MKQCQTSILMRYEESPLLWCNRFIGLGIRLFLGPSLGLGLGLWILIIRINLHHTTMVLTTSSPTSSPTSPAPPSSGFQLPLFLPRDKWGFKFIILNLFNLFRTLSTLSTLSSVILRKLENVNLLLENRDVPSNWNNEGGLRRLVFGYFNFSRFLW